MELQAEEKLTSLNDVPKLLRNVPEEYKESVAEITLKMMSHEAYNKPYDWSTDDFELGAPLGRGQFGRVFVARERKTCFMVAMKIMYKAELEKYNRQRQLLHEIEIQTHLKHPNILRMFTWFHDETRIFLIMEIAGGGELYYHLKRTKHGRFTESRTAKYVYQIADALNYSHAKKVIHRDLKPENILLTTMDDIKLSDFGCSSHGSMDRNTLCGTLYYLPPDMLKSETYDNTVDVWSLGVLCFELLTGQVPFYAKDNHVVFNKIQTEDITFPNFLTAGAKEFITMLLCKHSAQRITLAEVMRHPWVIEQRQLAFMERN